MVKRQKNAAAQPLLLVLVLAVGVILIGIGVFAVLRDTPSPESSDGSVIYTEGPTETTTTVTTVMSTTAMPTHGTTASVSVKTTAKTTAKPTAATTARDNTDNQVYVQGEAPSWNLLLVNPWNSITDEYIASVNLVNYATNKQIDARVLESLQRMIRDGAEYKLSAASLYRSVDLQVTLYQRKVTYYKNRGYEQKEAERLAATVVARPYTSEHHTGMAVDILGSGYASLEESFEKTPAFKWLKEHCAEYGFILRYPKEKEDITGVIYEPWHYRYVGVEAATEIMQRGLTLEEYLAEKY